MFSFLNNLEKFQLHGPTSCHWQVGCHIFRDGPVSSPPSCLQKTKPLSAELFVNVIYHLSFHNFFLKNRDFVVIVEAHMLLGMLIQFW